METLSYVSNRTGREVPKKRIRCRQTKLPTFHFQIPTDILKKGASLEPNLSNEAGNSDVVQLANMDPMKENEVLSVPSEIASPNEITVDIENGEISSVKTPVVESSVSKTPQTILKSSNGNANKRKAVYQKRVSFVPERSLYEPTPIASRRKKFNVRNLSSSFLAQPSDNVSESSEGIEKKKGKKNMITKKSVGKKLKMVEENLIPGQLSLEKRRKHNTIALPSVKKSIRSAQKKALKKTFGPTPHKNMIISSPGKSLKKLPPRQRNRKQTITNYNESVSPDGVCMDVNPWEIDGTRNKSDLNEFDYVLDIIDLTYKELCQSGTLDCQNTAVKEAVKKFCQLTMKKVSKQILMFQEIKNYKKEIRQEKLRLKELELEMNEARQDVIRRNYSVNKLKNQMSSTKMQQDSIKEFLLKLSKA